jgi:hypothetical protein
MQLLNKQKHGSQIGLLMTEAQKVFDGMVVPTVLWAYRDEATRDTSA